MPTTDQRDTKRAERAYTLWLGGFTLPTIAEQLGIHPSTVRRDIDRIRATIPRAEAHEIVDRQNDQLTQMMRPVYLRAARGDQKAIATMLKLMDHQAKIWGIYDLDLNDNGQTNVADAFKALGDAIRTAAKAGPTR